MWGSDLFDKESKSEIKIGGGKGAWPEWGGRSEIILTKNTNLKKMSNGQTDGQTDRRTGP